jgi:hypothetical protein
MVKEKKEIEERERKAVSELWRYQGEAKNVRLKADEVRLPRGLCGMGSLTLWECL